MVLPAHLILRRPVGRQGSVLRRRVEGDRARTWVSVRSQRIIPQREVGPGGILSNPLAPVEMNHSNRLEVVPYALI